MCSQYSPSCHTNRHTYILQHISCYLLSGFSCCCFQQVSNFVHINLILYRALKERIKRCQIRTPRWPENWPTPANPSTRKCCTKNFHNTSWEMHRCVVYLSAARETVWMQECKGTTFSVMHFVYLETELPETVPLYSGQNVYQYVPLSISYRWPNREHQTFTPYSYQ
jgi:hypothetical protein